MSYAAQSNVWTLGVNAPMATATPAAGQAAVWVAPNAAFVGDPESEFALSVGNTRFSCVKPGLYSLEVDLELVSSIVASDFGYAAWFAITRTHSRGSAAASAEVHGITQINQATVANNDTHFVPITAIVALGPGDYIEVRMRNVVSVGGATLAPTTANFYSQRIA